MDDEMVGRDQIEPPLGLDQVVDAMRDMEARLRSAAAKERHQSEEAERRISELTAEIDRLEKRNLQLERASNARMDGLVDELKRYLEESSRAQGALLRVTRHLLGVRALQPGELWTEQAPPPDRPRASSPVRGLLDPENHPPAVPADNRRTTTSPLGEDLPSGPFGTGEVTDEHRLMDLENLLDMRRLDAANRLTGPVQSLRRRRY